MLLAEPALQPIAPAHQRVDGAALIEFTATPDKTRLADLYQRAPCRVLFPDIAAGEPAQAVLLTTSGGLTGGDRIQVDFVASRGAQATLTTQAAEKLYRVSRGEQATQIDVRVEVGADAWAEWLAQETILFDGARLRRTFSANLAKGARLLAVESLVFGRGAMGESFRNGFVHDSWRIRRDGRLLFADALRLDGDVAALRSAAFGFGHASACGTLIYAAEDAPTLLAPLRAELAAHTSNASSEPVAHATLRDGLLLVRLLAADAALLRHAVIHAAGAIRSLAAGLAPRLPQVWYC
jgi:urease accessory protein